MDAEACATNSTGKFVAAMSHAKHPCTSSFGLARVPSSFGRALVALVPFLCIALKLNLI